MDGNESPPAVTRRRALKAGVGAATGATAFGATAGTASAQADAYDGYLADAEWDGNTVDASAEDEVEVAVGAGDNGLQFSPPAIYIEPGTTINFVWTGEGGAHNVVHDVSDPIFDSREEHEGDSIADEGFTYEFTYEDEHEGAHPYVCTPHRTLEMKGVIVVGEENVETDLRALGETPDDGLAMGSVAAGAAVFSVVALVGVAAYRELVGESLE